MRGIAGYEFLRAVGSGGRSRVFLARRPPRLPGEIEFVAVKVFAHESTSDTFRRGAARLRVGAAVRSPYLIQLYDIGQHDGIFYCAMEYLAGGSLAGPAYPVDPSRRVRAVGDAARALAALHRAGFVHGAVRPGNVLLDPYGAKLSDPDLSQVFSPGLRHFGPATTDALAFTDPAAVLGDPPEPAHDVWSVGLLLQSVAVGGLGYDAFPADGLGAIRRLAASRPAVSPDLAPALASIVRDCLALPPRRPSVEEVADRIAEVAAGMAAAPR